jgi:hypothetical protein
MPLHGRGHIKQGEMEVNIENVKIVNTNWSFEPCLSHGITLAGDGWGIVFGGYCLKGPAAADWIERVSSVLELPDFNEKSMIGKIIRVKMDGNSVVAIGHPIKDKWFCPREYFEGRYK